MAHGFYKNNRGFSLIELMIVVWIIGILAVTSINSYSKFVVRAQISEAISVASRIKIDSALSYQESGNFPLTMQRTLYSGAFIGTTRPVPTIFPDGTVMVLFGSQAHRKLKNQGIFLRPTVNEFTGVITWDCGGVAYSQGGNNVSLSYSIGSYLPESCTSL